MGTMLLIVIVLLIIIAACFIAFINSARLTRKDSGVDSYPVLSFDSQNLYRPVRALRRSIIDTVESSQDPAVHAMSGTVIAELNAAHDRVVLALQTRDQLRKAIDGEALAKGEAQSLLRSRNSAESDSEKLSITKAYEAKLNELAEYQKAKDIIKKIENEIDLTKASLSELKARLAISGAATDATERAEDLRTTLGALETIQSSVDEAQIMLHS
jgi:hypothetical protein